MRKARISTPGKMGLQAVKEGAKGKSRSAGLTPWLVRQERAQSHHGMKKTGTLRLARGCKIMMRHADNSGDDD